MIKITDNLKIIADNLSNIEEWVSQGSTDKEIAENLSMSYSTFKRYKKENEKLKAAVNRGKCKKNDEVVASLFKCCTGYHYYEEVPTKVKIEEETKDGNIITREEVKISSVKKYKGPDLNAQKYWLNNRDKTKWQDDPNKVINDKKMVKLKEKEVNSKTIL